MMGDQFPSRRKMNGWLRRDPRMLGQFLVSAGLISRSLLR